MWSVSLQSLRNVNTFQPSKRIITGGIKPYHPKAATKRLSVLSKSQNVFFQVSKASVLKSQLSTSLTTNRCRSPIITTKSVPTLCLIPIVTASSSPFFISFLGLIVLSRLGVLHWTAYCWRQSLGARTLAQTHEVLESPQWMEPEVAERCRSGSTKLRKTLADKNCVDDLDEGSIRF